MFSNNFTVIDNKKPMPEIVLIRPRNPVSIR
jgi:hypothetical protein